jgi:hypothetical protein
MRQTVSELLERLDQYKTLQSLCHQQDIVIPIEPGCQIVYSGQTYYVIAIRPDQLAMISEFTPLPVKETAIIYIPNWQSDEELVIIPNTDMLLQVIFDATGFFPTLVPGVEAAREVWKVQHPTAEQPYIFKTPTTALLELALHLLKIKNA